MLSIGDSEDIFLIAIQMTGNLEIESPRRLAGPDYFLLADNPPGDGKSRWPACSQGFIKNVRSSRCHLDITQMYKLYWQTKNAT